jgi:hypothetical protein
MSHEEFGQYAKTSLSSGLRTEWYNEYHKNFPDSEITHITVGQFGYLFDNTKSRTIVAFGVLHGMQSTPRDKARLSGYPKLEGPEYHRGHMIPHSAGGGLDINIFIQLGEKNTGEFRTLERFALSQPCCFYFVKLDYSGSSARPSSVFQGAMCAHERFYPWWRQLYNG